LDLLALGGAGTATLRSCATAYGSDMTEGRQIDTDGHCKD